MARNSLCAVPVIDLEVFPGQSRKMIEACEELGCFRIINHHKFLPPALSSEMKAVARSLMELSAEIKRRNKGVIRSSGYEEPTQFNPYFEALGLYDMASAQAVDAFCTQLDASPHQSKRRNCKKQWPTGHQSCQPATKAVDRLSEVADSHPSWPTIPQHVPKVGQRHSESWHNFQKCANRGIMRHGTGFPGGSRSSMHASLVLRPFNCFA
ncbi:uncharacterized protein LOC114279164 isoform X2 [Camellia sinensis]|uniref:uncharacterized protein LOC114279164 isoform X2 n=1 Tax=Camellia sinensis TaxID=4442 RepID=UPI0010368283|nr:uncharacterized protein LOC114279164 isoform X2 [Camellia sinensis]